MELLPADVVGEIVDRLERSDYIHTSLVNKVFRRFSLLKIKLITTQDELDDACQTGDLLSIVSSPCKEYNWNRGLFNACLGGYLNIVGLMISKGANDWNNGLSGACLGGHLPIIELMISKGVNNWNWGLYNACQGGHLPIVELMISKGANEWNNGLYHACLGGHVPIVGLMISKGANECYCGKTIQEHILSIF